MFSFEDVFNEVCLYCKKKVENGELTNVAFDLWIKPLEPVKMEENYVFLKFRSEFQRNTTLQNYGKLLEKAFSEVLGFDVKIKAVLAFEEEDNSSKIRRELEDSFKGAEYDYTFNTFIVGSSNEFAYAACNTVAQNAGGVYNPLFIHGKSGLGKTHLITAISNEIKSKNPNANVIYVTGEAFANELIEAIKQKKDTSQFHSKYRSAEVLLIDDVQFIAGKDSTQEEFFHTFNELHKTGRQIVLTSDRPPKDIKTLEERIRTRFEWGLIADVSYPDFETRVAIIKRKAELLELDISNDVAEYIANKLSTNIRQLEGCVKKLKASKHFVGTPATIAQAHNSVMEVLTDDRPTTVTFERILNEVANVYGVSADDIRSKKRSAQVSAARKVATYVIKEITNKSFKSIGFELGGRDHSTIIYYNENITASMEKDSRLRETIEDIVNNIREE